MIEKLLADLTAALDRNTAALLGNTEATPAKLRGRPKATDGTSAAPTATVAATATPEPIQTAAAPVAATVQTPPAIAPVATVSFKEAADALIALAEGVSREAAVNLLGKFGANAVPALKPADYAAFVAEANALVAGKSAPPSGAAGLV